MNTMNATQKLHNLGQSLWLDNITRSLLQGGLLRRYVDELSVTASLEQDGKPLPGVAQVAMQQGRYVGKLIRRRIAGQNGQSTC